jgi:DNA-binding MarR family transcriptional regulator
MVTNTTNSSTVTGLAAELHKRKSFDSPEQEAWLNVLRTQAVFGSEFFRLFKRHGLSEATYNVLRILRGAGEQGRSCSEIGEHMVAQVPDVTRLIDRLETAGLVGRTRTSEDRRVVMVAITPAGLDVLSRLDQPVLALHRAQFGHMTHEELRTLSDLLYKARHRPETKH